VYYGSSISGQNITVIDSNSTSTCENVGGAGSATMVVSGAEINSSGDVFVTATDGACF
jgi:hypothetical protein